MKGWRSPVLALLPLALGLGGYWLYWSGKADDFGSAVASVVGQQPDMRGFPYSLRADLPTLALDYGDAASLSVRAGQTEISTGPFGSSIAVITVADAGVEAALGGLPGLSIEMGSAFAQASLRYSNQIDRLSLVAEQAQLSSPLFARPVGAAGLEVHIRETPNAEPAAGATAPAQAEARVSGTFRFAEDLVLGAVLPLTVTDDGPLDSLAGWRDGGTVEIDGGLLSGTDGAALAGFDATVAALPGGRMAVGGTLTTDCPLTVSWLLGGGARPDEEFRRRLPAKFALGGTLDAPTLRELDTPSGGLARNREPPCPDLRR
ncbi:MAG: hypothetical protein V2J26_00535 [Pacificimonas sp.]|jgi:hypothetical protein|nr:hypothetical protein [Pacificimonas sp.]